MLKLISTMARMTAVVGLMAALPSIVAMQRNAVEHAGAAAAHGEDDNPLLDKSRSAQRPSTRLARAELANRPFQGCWAS